VREPEDSLGPARPDPGRRIRRAAAALFDQLRALLIPDRGVPPLVSMGRARLSIALAVAASLLVAVAVTARIDLGPTVRAEMARAPDKKQGPAPGGPGAEPPGEDKTDRDIAEEIDKRNAMFEVSAWLGTGLGMPAAIVGFAIALLLLGRFVGGKPTFARSFSASAIASLPWGVQSLIKAAAIWSQDRVGPEDVHQIVVSHLFIPPPDNPLLLRVAAAADGFALWSLVLAGFGLAAAAGISRRRSFVAVTISYLLLVLLLTSLFAP
jgi:hypothetical protein